MNLETVISNFNRGRMYLNEIQWLIDTVEHLKEENCNMAEKHAEKDFAIRELMQMNVQQQERIAQLENVKEMYLKANFVLLDQNDRLMKELELYKLQETKLIAQLKMMKNNSRLTNFYKMSEENLRLAEENKKINDGLSKAVEELERYQKWSERLQKSVRMAMANTLEVKP